MIGGNYTNIGALFQKLIAGAIEPAFFHASRLIEHGGGLQIIDSFDVLPGGEASYVIHVSHNPEIEHHLRKQIVQVFHNKDRTGHIGNVFTVFCALAGFWLKHSEMRLHEIDVNDTEVIFERYATMACRLGRK